jgi:hypothetical protein
LNERPSKDREGGDKEHERREGRQNGMSNRRVGREDREEWQNGRQRRNYEQEDGDQRARRVGDREKDRTRWDYKQAKDGLESEGDGDSRSAGRRDGQGRARFEQPWFRGDKSQEIEQKAGRNEWRRDRGATRSEDWERDRYAKAEQDPEWMDSTEMEEPNQKHTQEDFQKWKERMKAGGTPAEEKANAIEEKQLGVVAKLEPLKTDILSKPALKSTPEIDAAMDKFFATFNEKSADAKSTEIKAPRKGRFAALFSPPPDEQATPIATAPIESQEPKAATPHTSGMNEADQAGFQRILQMLGQRSNNTTPQDQSQPRPNPQPTAREHRREVPAQARSPENSGRPTELASRNSPLGNRASTGLETVLAPQSPTREHGPRPQSTSSKDAELLLRLMQQPSPPHIQGPPTQPSATMPSVMRQTPGILQMPENRNRPSKPQNENMMQLPFMEKPPGLDSARSEQQIPREVLQRRPTNGHAPSFFDEPFFNEHFRQTSQQQGVNPNQHRGQGIPIGMQRPPGFDQAPQAPPGWPTHHQMQAQHQHQHQQGPMAAPPGIPNPQHRGMNPPFPLTQQMPQQMSMGMPPLGSIPTGQRQRKYTGDGGASFPPGMGPPGFMANGPPPGFPAMPHGLGTGGGQFDGGGGMSPRHLMDLYARNGGRGGPARGTGNMLGGYQ